ncbi:MAG: hypothetical protein EHM55_23680 [Acidobacteria bacterium]|nr:MAG: hypothetical protein EHM55_23680 [Acidobacteriota bacterium]
MYALDCGSIGALEMSWFHQLLDGKRARPPKSSDSLTVLFGGAGDGGEGFGGAGGEGGSGLSDGGAGDCGGCGSCAGVAGACGAGVSVAPAVSDGAIGVAGCAPAQADSMPIPTNEHTRARAVERRMIGLAEQHRYHRKS